jgi:D-serine deaminase-like pyridoxal phosphate-dependent protein
MTRAGRSTGLDPQALGELAAQRLSPSDKSLPTEAAGLTAAEFLATAPRLSAFLTPLLVLDDAALDANTARMAAWCAEQGVDLAPHGKTTMAPALWERQLQAGAWGITVATPSQLRVAVGFGVPRVQLANALVDPAGLAWLARALDADPGLDVVVWADAVETVAAMDAVLAPLAPRRPVDVVVELGGPGGRTGARTPETADALAAAVTASPWVRLRGVGGYEGSLAHDSSDAGLGAVRRYLADVAALHTRLLAAGAYAEAGEALVTAGGSAYFDDVVTTLGPLADPAGDRGLPTRVVLRSGAYQVHDDGFYRGISPFSRSGGSPFTSAMHAWARVVSRPEPGLALLDAGKRDVPFDEGLPEPQLVADSLGAPARPLTGAHVSAVNDQHAFLRLDPATADEVRVGQVVRLGLSHPCTAFDKWRWIPVVASADEPDPVVVDLVRTLF